ncbi:hypothetical protein bcgnr5390_63140 [Bacillus luti]|uniref:hypothetical protein n=1 Tax=Bacillaceae TaxID=186817 RepID=UPI00296068F6|nr:hypothetical protein [Bacillus cereus]HEF5066732.1 hypothetical protein [Bacillus cereus]HEF5238607.1 hypothetical protein [Bacillus cereus]
MKKLFLIVASLLLTLVIFAPMTNVKAVENNDDSQEVTTISIPIYEYPDNNFRAAKKEIAKANFHVDSSNRIVYEVVMNKGYTFESFSGLIMVTDLTSGLSQGRFTISGKSGSVQIAKLKNHQFYASISGAVKAKNGFGYSFDGAHLRWIYK